MKVFSAKVDDGREGQDGKPSIGPVYRNLLAKNGYPPPDPFPIFEGPAVPTVWFVCLSMIH